MKKVKNIIAILILNIIIATIFPGVIKGATAKSPIFKTSFELENAGEQGVVTDGKFIYTCFWNNPGRFDKYNMEGDFIEEFTILGVNDGIRDLTYDGTYFYGGTGIDSKIYKLNFTNKTLVNVLNTEVDAVRHCSYDSEKDGFWVGNWEDLYFVNREGKIQITSEIVHTDIYGSAYDNHTAGGPYLWLFEQDGVSKCIFKQYKIAEDALTGVTIDLGEQEQIHNGGIAGGAFVGASGTGKNVLYGNIQRDPNVVLIYDIQQKYNIIKGDTENGTYEVSVESAYEGDNVDIMVSPSNGYELKTIRINNDKIGLTESKDKYTFKMPGEDAIIAVDFQKIVEEEETVVTQKAQKAEKDETPKTGIEKNSIYEMLFGMLLILNIKI